MLISSSQGMVMTAFYQTFIRLPLFSLSVLTIMLNHANAETITQENPAVVVLNKVVVPDNEKLNQCTYVSEDLVRLACYDKVLAGDVQLNQKIPLDLSKTFNESLQQKKVIPILAKSEQIGDVNVKEISMEILPANTKNQTTLTITDSQAVNEKPENSESLSSENFDKNQKDKQILRNVGVTEQEVASYSALSNLFDLDRNDPKGVFSLRPHYQTYVLPIFFSKRPNKTPYSPSQPIPTDYPDLQHVDSKFQISVKTKMIEDVFNANADLWFGYTQQSYWQVYNEGQSRPFRVSDYQPEVFITQPAKAKMPLNGNLRMIGAGLVHQSNGQSDPLSRSWNRAYAMAGVEWGKLTVVPRVWMIIPNIKKHVDNADIGNYMGYGDIRWQYPFSKKDAIGGLVRYNPFKNKGAIQIDYTYPIRGGMKAYLQLFHGYGENIQNYNHADTNIGIGLMFNDFTGL